MKIPLSILFLCLIARAMPTGYYDSADLSWQYTGTPDFFTVYMGTAHNSYSVQVNAGTHLMATIPNLWPGTRYYFCVGATVRGVETRSAEINSIAPLQSPQALSSEF